MKTISKAIFPLVLLVTMLTSCGGSISPPKVNPTSVMETAMSFVLTKAAETQTPTLLPSPIGSTTAIPGPDSYLSPVLPNPGQQVYIDPEGWYLIYFPDDMKPKDKPNLFSGKNGFFETGYLPELGYMSRAINVCAWLANVESKPEESAVEWHLSDRDLSSSRCSVLTEEYGSYSTKYEIFENPSADPEHRFIYVKTFEYPAAVNKVIASLVWLKPIHETKFESVLAPVSPKEISIWEYSAPILPNASVTVTEYALPAEAQVGPGEEMLVNFVPEEMLPDWAAYRENSPTSTPEPDLEEQLKSLGYELRVVNPDPNNYRRQLFRDNRVLFDRVYKVSDFNKFSTEEGPITAFIVTTMNKPEFRDISSYVIQNDVISEWEYNHQDPGFSPILYEGEVLWLKASKDFNHIQVIKSNQDVVYSFTTYTEPLYSTNRFTVWNGHWVLVARDFLIQDGENINKKLNFDEIFSWNLIDNKPAYFFRKGPRIGFSYNEGILPLEYQEVAHHYCCGYSVNNPSIVNDSAHFFGKRNGIWYYVVLKFK